jgi:hypothetical protein
MTKTLSWNALSLPDGRKGRLFLAAVLRTAGRVLDRMAVRLASTAASATAPAAMHPVLEFYAEAGAPEGALYVDGELVARLPGITRL